MPKRRVFIDTNVVIEAFRTGTWTALCNKFSIETVEQVIEEALTGDHTKAGRVDIPAAALRDGLAARHTVSKLEYARAILEYPEISGLDLGEKYLLAWLVTKEQGQQITVVLSTADKGAIRSSNEIGWMDACVSLEELLEQAGVSRQQIGCLENQHRAAWLKRFRTEVQLDSL